MKLTWKANSKWLNQKKKGSKLFIELYELQVKCFGINVVVLTFAQLQTAVKLDSDT